MRPSDVFSSERVERIPLVIGPSSSDVRRYDSYDDYRYSGQRVGNLRMRILTLTAHPHTEIAVPVESTLRISLDDIVDALHILPNIGLVRRITIIDEPHSEEQWLRQTQNNAGLCVKAEAFPRKGEIRVYATGIDASFSGTVLHEWNHLLKHAYPNASHAFDRVGTIETFELGASAPFDALVADEEWSYLGEHLADFKRQPAEALILASALPIRSSIWGSAFGATLDALPESEFGVDRESHQSMRAFLEASARPEAIGALRELEDDPDPEVGMRARDILRYLTATVALSIMGFLLISPPPTFAQGDVYDNGSGASKQTLSIEISQASADLHHGLAIEIEADRIDSGAEDIWKRSSATVSKYEPQCLVDYNAGRIRVG